MRGEGPGMILALLRIDCVLTLESSGQIWNLGYRHELHCKTIEICTHGEPPDILNQSDAIRGIEEGWSSASSSISCPSCSVYQPDRPIQPTHRCKEA
jgi:hypothetical protein